MAMERLVYTLRQTGNPTDESIANGIDAFHRLRGRDIPIRVFLGLEELDQSSEAHVVEYKKRRPMSLYEQTAASIRDKILLGEYPTGSKVPSERILLAQYPSISRGTLREALRMLAQEGLIKSRQGMGTFVLYRERAIPSLSEYIENFPVK